MEKFDGISERYNVIRYKDNIRSNELEYILKEHILSIYVNGKRYVNLVCTNKNLYELVIGNLFTENIINDISDIKNIEIYKESGKAFIELDNDDVFINTGDSIETVRTLTTACGKQYSIAYYLFNAIEMEQLTNDYKVCYKTVLEKMREFQHSSDLYKTTRGIHSCGLYSGSELLYLMEDIGRHNTVDKILGYAMSNKIDLSETLLITSGRVSSDMLTKVIKARIPILVARSIATDSAIAMAKKYNVTLIGYVRDKSMIVYTGDDRVLYKDDQMQGSGII